VLILRLVLPRGAHGHAGFPRTRQGHSGNGKLRGFDGSPGDDDVGIELPGKIAKTDRFPIKKKRIDFAVVSQQLAELGLVVFHQARVIPRLDTGNRALDGLAVLVKPPEIVGLIINAGGNALGTEGIEDLLGDIAMKGGIHDAERGCLGVEHGKAGMVLGGEHNVADAGQTR
jgi:hypothetical protein